MTDNKLEVDEMQRAANYEAVKGHVESRVNADIVADAASRRRMTKSTQSPDGCVIALFRMWWKPSEKWSGAELLPGSRRWSITSS